MRILHLYKDYFPVLGGIENHVRDLARMQVRRGHDVTVLVTGPAAQAVEEDDAGVRVIKVPRMAVVASTPLSLEFYAHVRYFTYRTMVEFIGSFGFALEAVYLALPSESSRYKALRQKSRLGAGLFRNAMRVAYWMSPRWASEPVLCFRKSEGRVPAKVRKVIL